MAQTIPISASVLERVEKLGIPMPERSERAAYAMALSGVAVNAQFTKAQRTILAFPPIMDPAEWNRIASA